MAPNGELLNDVVLFIESIPFSRGFPDPGIEPRSPALQVDSYRLSHLGSPGTIQSKKGLLLLLLLRRFSRVRLCVTP